VVSPLATSFAGTGIGVMFQYTITNTGGQTLTGIAVHNSVPDLDATCLQSTLGPGQGTECLAQHVTTVADVNRGGVTTTATATGLPATGPEVTSSPVSATIPSRYAAALALAKASPFTPTFSAAGQTVGYLYRVENSGDLPLSGITVHDPHPGLSPMRCDATTLAPREVTLCAATNTTTAADLAAGRITDTATVSADPPSGPSITSNPATWTIYTPQPWLGLTKTVAPTTYAAGTPLHFTYTLDATGNVELTGVTVTDALAGLSPVTCPATVLRRGRPMTCAATYTATAADVTAGSVTNTATATGNAPNGAKATAGPATATAFAGGPPAPPANPAPRFVFVPAPFPLPLGTGK
jgi:uncharacterized repeat protein (TIGR01451 family)